MINESASAMHDDCNRDDEREYVCQNGCKCGCVATSDLRSVTLIERLRDIAKAVHAGDCIGTADDLDEIVTELKGENEQ